MNKINCTYFILLAASFSWCDDSSSQTALIKGKLEKCIEKGQTTAAQVECYSIYADSSDKAMNTVYQSISNRLMPDLKKKFKEAQRAWVQFRDKENSSALSLYSMIQGTIRQQYAAGQVFSMNQKRLKELEEYISVMEEAGL